ncbi:MAG: complement resistance protein TraT [Planctomycetota bacterium]
MSRIVTIVILLALLAPTFSGCASVSGGSERYKEMNVQAQWVDGVPEFVGDRPGGSDRSVTIQVRNPSGLDLDTRRLRALLSARMEEEGWSVTKDPAEARYDITAVIKFWGRNENLPDDSGSMGKLLGAAAGGAAAYNQVKDKSSNTRKNATIAGAYIGSALGDMIDRRTRSEAWTMIVETRIDEAVEGTVKTELNDRSKKGAVTGAASAIGASGVVAGAEGNRTRRNQQYSTERNKVRIKNTLVITARQIQLTEAVALPAIETRLERIIPEILP